ncbi:25S rRNA (cytosine2870-C5)-methyltransferase [Pancytospora philotis]|nr:25S rRNA (cytosine2870-C5)-methyltransferase [Pancytospora philotis]
MLEESYNEFLLMKIKQLFPKKELQSYLEANEKQRPTVIRVNSLLKRRKDLVHYLTNRKVETGSIDWSDTALVVFRADVPLGATPEYLAGYYTIQGACSMLPVLNLELGENLTAVDLCAAPGGKSTHMAALMDNTGTLYCNDVCKERTYALKSNLQRMGVENAVVTNMDAGEFNVGKVDRVLLDAPCSGTGVISKDPSIKTSKSKEEIKKIVQQQKKLILHAFDMLKVRGVMIYSTCSILVDENESVVDYLLAQRKGARVAELDVAVGKDGFTGFRGESFHGTLSRARRLYPHVHNMDGFFYCKITRVE